MFLFPPLSARMMLKMLPQAELGLMSTKYDANSYQAGACCAQLKACNYVTLRSLCLEKPLAHITSEKVAVVEMV